MVDAKHVLLSLSESREAREQIAFADQIVLNKTDLVTGEELRMIEARLRRLNPLAKIHRTVRSQVALDAVLGRGGFDLERIIALEPQFLNPAHGEEGHVHDDACEGDHDHHQHDHGERLHDDDIKGVSLRLESAVDGQRVTRWLNELLAAQGPDILRAKGIVNVAGRAAPPGVSGRPHDAGGRPATSLARRRSAGEPHGVHRPQPRRGEAAGRIRGLRSLGARLNPQDRRKAATVQPRERRQVGVRFSEIRPIL